MIKISFSNFREKEQEVVEFFFGYVKYYTTDVNQSLI